MAKQRPGAQIARYDQDLAAASADVDLLVGIAQSTAAEVDEQQALTEVAGLVAGREAADVAGLLTAAIWQLAGLGRKDEAVTGPGNPPRDTG